MPGPTQNRSLYELKKLRRQEKRVRRLTKREEHRNRVMYVVTWGLLFVFGVMSVGLFIMFRPSSAFKNGGRAPVDQQQQLQETLATLQKNAEASPADESWHFEEASTFLKMGQIDPAIKQLQETLKINPSHLQALHMLAQLYLMKNQPKKAAAALKKGVAAEKNFLGKQNRERKAGEPAFTPDATTRAMLMQAYLAMGPGHAAQARAAARQALTLQPDDFVDYLRTFALQMAIMRKTNLSRQAIHIALQEATKLQEPKTVADIKELQRMVANLTRQSVKPERSAIPAASSAPSASPRAAASPSPAAASPAASPSAASSPSAAASPVPK